MKRCGRPRARLRIRAGPILVAGGLAGRRAGLRLAGVRRAGCRILSLASLLLTATIVLADPYATPAAPAGDASPRTAASGSGSASGVTVSDPESRKRSARTAAAPSSCLACHGRLDGAMAEPVKVWSSDAHALAGLGCESCHGGDPSTELGEDADAAMSQTRGFRPPPDRLHVAELCARCHADAAFMRQYNPRLRVDQLAEYRTSVHGQLNAKGDPVPATCIDCHGFHGILPVASPGSPVYPTNVPATCSRCHSDAKRMGPYGIRTDPYDGYRRSVHGSALLERGDTAAPACNDCHGNHGAAPPGVRSVAHVCGQCHGREATLFGGSFKKPLFDELQVAECTVCHDHHRIRHPTPELFHGPSSPQVSNGKVTGTDPFTADLGDIAAGRKATAVWRAVVRPHVAADDTRLVHWVQIDAEASVPLVLDATVRPSDGPPPGALRRAVNPALAASLSIEPLPGPGVEPGDALLFRLEVEAGPGGAVRGVKVRDMPGEELQPHEGSACLACHRAGDSCDVATERMYGALTALERDLRDASALLRRAEIAGMEVSAPAFALKSLGTTAAVEARALIHSFDPDRLIKRTQEGQAVAASAREAGLAALAELQFRRKGLAVSLVLIGMVLLGLALKIRQVDREKTDPAAPARP